MKLSLPSFLFAISFNAVAPVFGMHKDYSKECGACPNGSYFRFVPNPEVTEDGDDDAQPYSIEDAINDTPQDCALAPIESEGDVLAASSAVPSSTLYAYVGAYRPTDTYFDDCGTNYECDEPTTGWVNYSGSEVPDNTDVWEQNGDGEVTVGNSPRVRLNAMVRGGSTNRLIDALSIDPAADGAVYKCCVPTQAACPLDNVVEETIVQ